MVKIQGKSVRVDGKDYHQDVVTIPKDFMKKLGWKPGDDLLPKVSAEGHQLIFDRILWNLHYPV